MIVKVCFSKVLDCFMGFMIAHANDNINVQKQEKLILQIFENQKTGGEGVEIYGWTSMCKTGLYGLHH